MKVGHKSNHVIPVAHSRSRRHLIMSTGMLATSAAAFGGTVNSFEADGLDNLQATPVGDSNPNPLQLIYSFEAQFTDMVLIGLTPRGIRFNLPYSGQVTEGPLAGAEVQGVDYLVIRPDGVGVMDVKGFVTASAGVVASYQATGYVHLPEGVELPLDMMLDPGFTWPDMELGLHGFGLYETGVEELSWLNRTALAMRGVANPGVAALSASAYSFIPIPGMTAE